MRVSKFPMQRGKVAETRTSIALIVVVVVVGQAFIYKFLAFENCGLGSEGE